MRSSATELPVTWNLNPTPLLFRQCAVRRRSDSTRMASGVGRILHATAAYKTSGVGCILHVTGKFRAARAVGPSISVAWDLASTPLVLLH